MPSKFGDKVTLSGDGKVIAVQAEWTDPATNQTKSESSVVASSKPDLKHPFTPIQAACGSPAESL